MSIFLTALDNTPLHSAVQGNANGIARKLVDEYDADINAFNCMGHTRLYHAIEYGFEDLIHYFIGKGADINTQASLEQLGYEDEDGDYGGGAFHCAVASGSFSVTQVLLSHPAELELQDVHG